MSNENGSPPQEFLPDHVERILHDLVSRRRLLSEEVEAVDTEIVATTIPYLHSLSCCNQVLGMVAGLPIEAFFRPVKRRFEKDPNWLKKEPS